LPLLAFSRSPLLRRPPLAPNGGGSFAQWRLPLNFLRGIMFQICTAVSAGLLPPLRQTASARCTTATKIGIIF